MAAMTNYLEQKLLLHVLKANNSNTGGSYTQPTNLYVALTTADPTDTGSTSNEVTGGSYARTQIIFTDGTSVTNGTVTNNAAVTFPTASAAWGTVTHFVIMDASSGGNPLFYGALTSSKVVDNGDVFQFNTNQLSLQIDN